MSFRFGTDDDLAAVEAFHDRLYHHTFPFSYEVEYRYRMAPSDVLLLTCDGDRLIGYLAGIVDGEVACIFGIAVDTQSRQMKVGTRRTRWFAVIAAAEESPLIALQAVPVPKTRIADLVRFYEKCGSMVKDGEGPILADDGKSMEANPGAGDRRHHAEQPPS